MSTDMCVVMTTDMCVVCLAIVFHPVGCCFFFLYTDLTMVAALSMAGSIGKEG